MKGFDIIAYIENNLTGPELEAFEKELKQNPDFAREVRLQRQLTEDIEVQMLRNTVSKALSKPAQPSRLLPRWLWILGPFGVVLALLVIYWQFSSPEAPGADTGSTAIPTLEAPTSPFIDPVEDEESPDLEELPIQQEIQEEKDNTSRPIAEIQPTDAIPAPLYTAPNVRGAQQENKAKKALLDALWYTEYPPAGMQFAAPFDQIDQILKDRNFSKAYVRLQLLERKIPKNDSLSYLKGYCLLEMGEGAEALQYFSSVEDREQAWAPYLEWYRGLAYLLTGAEKEAINHFESIRFDTEHPFQRHAGKAILLLD
jgi:hypothetical protein